MKQETKDKLGIAAVILVPFLLAVGLGALLGGGHDHAYFESCEGFNAGFNTEHGMDIDYRCDGRTYNYCRSLSNDTWECNVVKR